VAFDCDGSTGVDCVIFVAAMDVVIEYFEWIVVVCNGVIVD
jgi:hypothetical protein